MNKYLIETCCGSADDVIESAKAGADRVELNSNLFQGGLTPTIGTLRVAKRYADIPVMCMVRPREGGFCYTDAEYETALADAQLLLDNGADGIVFGFLDEGGVIDEKRCAEFVKLANGKSTVFHRAIDVTGDWRHAMDVLIGLGVTRILTSGQSASVFTGAKTILDMIDYAGGRIEVLPGGDITPGNVKAILEAIPVSAFHLALLKPCIDGSTSLNPSIHFGGALYPPEDIYRMTDCGALGALKELVNGLHVN